MDFDPGMGYLGRKDSTLGGGGGGGAAGLYPNGSTESHSHEDVGPMRQVRDDDGSELPYVVSSAPPARKETRVLRRPSSRRKPPPAPMQPAIEEKDDDLDEAYEGGSVHDLAEVAWTDPKPARQHHLETLPPTSGAVETLAPPMPVSSPMPVSTSPAPMPPGLAQPYPLASTLPDFPPVPTHSRHHHHAANNPVSSSGDGMAGVGAFRAPAAFDAYQQRNNAQPQPHIYQTSAPVRRLRDLPKEPWNQGVVGGNGQTWEQPATGEDQWRHQLRGGESAYPTECVALPPSLRLDRTD